MKMSCPRKTEMPAFRRKQASEKWAQETAQKSRWDYFLRKIPTMAPSAGFLACGSAPAAPSHPALLAGQWHLAAGSPLTVTGSLGTCTRFPFTPAAELGTEGADFCVRSILSARLSLCQWRKKKFPAEEALSREKEPFKRRTRQRSASPPWRSSCPPSWRDRLPRSRRTACRR